MALCSVVRAELLWDAQYSARVSENLDRAGVFPAPLKSLAFDDDCAEHYATLRASLADCGHSIRASPVLVIR